MTVVILPTLSKPFEIFFYPDPTDMREGSIAWGLVTLVLLTAFIPLQATITAMAAEGGERLTRQLQAGSARVRARTNPTICICTCP